MKKATVVLATVLAITVITACNNGTNHINQNDSVSVDTLRVDTSVIDTPVVDTLK